MDLTINEFYGQTEVNLVVGNCCEIMPVRRGSMGKPIPGHRVEVVDDRGERRPPGNGGRGGDPAPRPGHVSGILAKSGSDERQIRQRLVSHRRSRPRRTRTDISGSWAARTILSPAPGYRIGPAEIEDCLHQAHVRGHGRGDRQPGSGPGRNCKGFYRVKAGRLSQQGSSRGDPEFCKNPVGGAHEYPREIDFVKELPMTTTGKIMRRELRKMDIEKRVS